MTTTPAGIDLQGLKETYDRDGYAVARWLFSPAEVEEIKAEFEKLNHAQKGREYFKDDIHDPTDPLFQYPRLVHPPRFSALAMHYMLPPAVRTCLAALMGE